MRRDLRQLSEIEDGRRMGRPGHPKPSPSKRHVHVRLSAIAFFDESDLTELTQGPEGMANTLRGDGDGHGFVDELDKRPGCKKTPFALQCLSNGFHRALLAVPFHFSFEGICRYRDPRSPAWFASGYKVGGEVCFPEQAVNGVEPASPLGAARSQLCVPPPFKPFPALY